MAISGGDGSIVLTTEVDTKGIEKGTANIKNATERTNKSIKNLGLELSRALNAGDTKSAQLINNFKKATEEVERQSAKVDELKSKLQGLESGQIKIEDKGTAKLQSDFEKATASIEKTQNEINELYMQLDNLQMNAFRAPGTGDIVLTGKEQAEFDKLNAKLDELEPKLEANKQKANELGIALRNATGTGTQAEIEKTRAKLAEAEGKLQNLSTKAEIAGQKMNGNMNTYHKEVSSTEQALSKLGKRIGRLAISALIFSAITKAFTELRKTIGSMLMSNEQFRNSVYMLQASLWTLAQPIYEAVLPALQSLMSWLTKAILYVATFFSALGGKTLRQTIASAKALNSQASAYKNVARASKEARKQLASFDDLSILQNGIATTGAFEGVSSEFDNLENMLSEEDMQKIQEFGDWVMLNREPIKTALEAAGWGLAAIGLGSFIKTIGQALGWFKKKDKGLDTQTKKTQTETEAVGELSKAWSFAPAFAYGLVPALDALTNVGLEFIPTFQTAADKSYGLAPAFDTSKESAYGLSPALDGATSSATNLSPALDTAQQSAYSLSPALEEVTQKVNELNPPIVDTVKTIETEVKKVPVAVKEQAQPTKEATGEVVQGAADGIEEKKPEVKTSVDTLLSAISTALITYLTITLFTDWKTGFNTFLEKVKAFFKRIDWGLVIGGTALAVLGGLALLEPTPFGEAGVAALIGGLGLSPIPGYARGTVVPPNRPHLAWFGDNKQEPEIVSPVSTMKQAFAEAMIEMGGNFGGGSKEIVLEVDGREFGRAVVDLGGQENRRIGTRLVIA